MKFFWMLRGTAGSFLQEIWMHFEEWSALPEKERERQCQMLDPYEDKEVFKGVEEAFLSTYGGRPGVQRVHCGLGPFIGPYNSVVVELKGSEDEAGLPESFMGFPVLLQWT